MYHEMNSVIPVFLIPKQVGQLLTNFIFMINQCVNYFCWW